MLANDGELDGKRYLSHAAMDELRKEQTGTTKVNYSLGYHLRNGMFGHGRRLRHRFAVNPATGMVAVFMTSARVATNGPPATCFLRRLTSLSKMTCTGRIHN